MYHFSCIVLTCNVRIKKETLLSSLDKNYTSHAQKSSDILI